MKVYALGRLSIGAILLAAGGCGLTQEQCWTLEARWVLLEDHQAAGVIPDEVVWVVPHRPSALPQGRLNLLNLSFEMPEGWEGSDPKTKRFPRLDNHGRSHGYAMSSSTVLKPRRMGSPTLLLLWLPTPPEWWDELAWSDLADPGFLTGAELFSRFQGPAEFLRQAMVITPADVDCERLARGDVAERVRICLLACKVQGLERKTDLRIERFARGEFKGFVLWVRDSNRSVFRYVRLNILQGEAWVGEMGIAVDGELADEELRRVVEHLLATIGLDSQE